MGARTRLKRSKLSGRYANGADGEGSNYRAPDFDGTRESARKALDFAHMWAGNFDRTGFTSYEEADVWAHSKWLPISIAARDEAQWVVVQLPDGGYGVTFPVSAQLSSGKSANGDVRPALKLLSAHNILSFVRGSGHTHPFSELTFSGHDAKFLQSIKKTGLFSEFKLSLSNQNGEYRTASTKNLSSYFLSTGAPLEAFDGTLVKGVNINNR